MALQFPKELHVSGSDKLPEVNFLPDGNLKIEGRIISDSVDKFFSPLLEWVSYLNTASVIIDIKSDYLSANGLVYISKLLCTLEDNRKVKEILLNWYYDEEDEDFYDKGIFLEDRLKRTRVNHISYIENYMD